MNYILDNKTRIRLVFKQLADFMKKKLVDDYSRKVLDESLKLVSELLELVVPKYILNIAIKPATSHKTLNQLRFVWGILIDDVYRHYLESGYFNIPEFKEFTKEYKKWVIKEVLYNECGRIDVIVCPMTEKAITPFRTMSNMTKEEMSDFITNIINWCDAHEITLRPEARYTWVLNLLEHEIKEARELKFPESYPDYLAYIRTQSCIISGKFGSTAHHVKDPRYCGAGQKSPDWYTVPIRQEYHVKSDGHISTYEILNSTKSVLNGLDIETFCRLCFLKWKNKRG